MSYIISEHAQEEIDRRGIPLDVIDDILSSPEQVVPDRNDRNVYQSKVRFGSKDFLVRVVVVDNVYPAIVVTVYRTGKIDKYWRS
jgi:hypothetical protein